MRRAVVFLLLNLLTICGAAQAKDVDWPGLEPRDWDALDSQLDRVLLVRMHMFSDEAPERIRARYEELVTPPLEFPPVSIEEFAGLAQAARDRRHKVAEGYSNAARRSLLAFERVRDAGLSNEGLKSLPASRSDRGSELVPRAMGGLGAAVAADPRDPVAWYDLAYFAGCVGDGERQARALEGFRAAVGTAEPAVQAALFPWRIKAELDQAWLHRERGELEEGLAATLRASALMKEDPAANGELSTEARLVAALLHADCGDVDQAAILAKPLKDLETRERNRIAHTDPKLHQDIARDMKAMSNAAAAGQGLWAKYVPNAYQPTVPAQSEAWDSRAWPWARNWVLALVELRLGNVQGALKKTAWVDPRIMFPQRLGYRFWNDLSRIAEAAGDKSGARRCTATSVIHRPFFIFYSLEGMRGLARTADPAEGGYSYFLGAGEFYGGGSLFSYAANSLLMWELETIPARKLTLERQALRWLTACVRRNIRLPQALAMRGRMRFLMGHGGAAEVDLLQADELLRKEGRQDGEVPLLLGLIAFNLKDYAGAQPWLERFTAHTPEVGVGWRALGLTEVFLGNLEDGEAALTRSVELEPENAGGWFNRALVRMKRGDREGTLADLDRAAELIPDNPDIPRIREAASSGPLPDVGLNATPITLTASRQEARLLARLQGGARLDLAAEAGDGGGAAAGPSWQMDEEDAQEQLADLRRAYRYDPSPQTMADLARALLALDFPREVQGMLAPHFETDLEPAALVMLLEADRRLGEGARAISLAHGLPVVAEVYPDPEVWAQVGAICMAAGRRDLGLRALELNVGRPRNEAAAPAPAATGGSAPADPH